MRSLVILLAGAVVASCTTAPPQPRSAEAEAEFQKLIAGKTAGQPVACLQSHRTNDMVVIDDDLIAFREGSNRVYVNRMQGGCNNLGSGFYTLVTRSIGPGLCRGDIAQVADLATGSFVGSCVVGDFVPYSRAQGD